MSLIQLQSRTLEVNDSNDATETYYQKGWTDGLPIVAPTVDRVREMLEAGGHAEVAPRNRTAG